MIAKIYYLFTAVSLILAGHFAAKGNTAVVIYLMALPFVVPLAVIISGLLAVLTASFYLGEEEDE